MCIRDRVQEDLGSIGEVYIFLWDQWSLSSYPVIFLSSSDTAISSVPATIHELHRHCQNLLIRINTGQILNGNRSKFICIDYSTRQLEHILVNINSEIVSRVWESNAEYIWTPHVNERKEAGVKYKILYLMIELYFLLSTYNKRIVL